MNQEEEEIIKKRAKLSGSCEFIKRDSKEFLKVRTVVKRNINQHQGRKANKKLKSKYISNKRDLKNISTKSSTTQSTKSTNYITQLKITPVTNVPWIEQCAAEIGVPLELIVEESDEESNEDTTDIQKEITENITSPNDENQIDFDSSTFDVFADLIVDPDLKDSDEDDENEKRISYSIRPRYACEICKKVFKNKPNLDDHTNMFHKNHENFYLCPRCPKKFATLSELKKHIKEHIKIRNRKVVCEICGKIQNNKTHLEEHVKGHSEGRSYSCHICQASLKTLFTLNHHLKRHTGIKNYKCDQCDAAFFDCSDYKRHLMKHGVIDKEFHCTICDSRFYERKFLRQHIIKVHKISGGEEMKFLPEIRQKSALYVYAKKPEKKPKDTIKNSPKESKSEVQNEPIDDINEVLASDPQLKEDNTSCDVTDVKNEEFLIDFDEYYTVCDKKLSSVDEYYTVCDKKLSSVEDDASSNDSISSSVISDKSNCSVISDEKLFIDDKLTETFLKVDEASKHPICLSLDDVEKSVQSIVSSVGSSELNTDEIKYIHQKIDMITADMQILTKKISKQNTINIEQFLLLNDIDTIDRKLNDQSFNDEFVKYFQSNYSHTSPYNLEDIEAILNDSFLGKYSVKSKTISNRKFIDYKCLMKTLHKIWTEECRTYREFYQLMRRQVWKVMQKYKQTQKAQE